ncbi:MAG: ABC transporter substrate binding protein [Syntrophobacteraceae bacterium]|nr:hypothetical protein [Desulfobacteraceae bacterium]
MKPIGKIAVVLSILFCCPGFWLPGNAAEEEDGNAHFKHFLVQRQILDSDATREEELGPVSDDGRKVRIAVMESGVWTGFIFYFDAVVDSLTHLGWGDPQVYESLTKAEKENIPAMIAALRKKNWSEYIEFPEDAYVRLAMDTRKQEAASIAARTDIDMVVGLGTWAGQELKNQPDSYKTPCVILGVSNPIGSGILQSTTDSGRDNITGSVEMNRFERQLRLFHDIVGFKRLGVVYAGSDPTAAQYAAVEDIKTLRRERGFEVLEATDVPPSGDMEEINRKYIAGVESIVGRIDAFYLTLQNGVNAATLPQLVKIFNSHGIPTFYMGGSEYVRKGVLLSIATNWKTMGAFNARNIARILRGARPRDLDMIFDAEPRVAINLATATAIAYDPPVDVLASADEIYTTIEP